MPCWLAIALSGIGVGVTIVAAFAYLVRKG